MLAKKHTDNYWVEKNLMNQDAKDGVGVTSNRELIREYHRQAVAFRGIPLSKWLNVCNLCITGRFVLRIKQ